MPKPLSRTEQQERDWFTRYYEGAVGLTVTGVAWVTEVTGSDGTVYGLEPYEQMAELLCTDEHGETYRLGISRDPEGNGPGFLFGLPEPE